MGRLAVRANNTGGNIERNEYTVIVWDAKRNKRITPTGDNELIPIRVKNRPYGSGSYGGTAELVHTGYAFSRYNRHDDDILIGAYVLIMDGKEPLFSGTITNLQLEASAESNMVTYQCRDLWHSILDSAVYQDFVGGISSGGMIGVLAGKGPYIVRRSNGQTVTTETISYEPGSPDGPRMPVSGEGTILVDVSPTLINAGKSSIPRSFNGEDTAQIIERMAEEQEVDMLGIVPAKPNASILGTITSYRIGERERTIVFGAASENDNADLSFMPFVRNISGTISYDGVVTNIEIRGGAITQGFTEELVPAWSSSLNASALLNPDLIDMYPGLYGMVGRAYYVPTASPLHGVLPFTDVPNIRAAVEGMENGEIDPAGNTDTASIWEHIPAKGESTSDVAWEETGENYILTKYNRDMPLMRRLNIDGISNLDWQLHNYALVIFQEPQIYRSLASNGSGGLTRTYEFKRFELQATKFLGNMIYRTGHRGKYPRTRTRYIDAPQWRRQKPYSGVRYAPGSVGRLAYEGGTYFDNTAAMTPEAERAVKNSSKSEASLVIEIDGIDKSWLFGDTITTIIDTDGEVVEDQLDWTVRGVDYTLGTEEGQAITTTLSLDNETRF